MKKTLWCSCRHCPEWDAKARTPRSAGAGVPGAFVPRRPPVLCRMG